MKNDIIILAQSLNDSDENEINKNALIELVSNMRAMLEHLEDKYNIRI